MASRIADCGIPSCRAMWAVSVIMLAPVAGLLLWPAADAGAANLTDGEPVVFMGCVPINQSDAGAANLTDDEQAAFMGCVSIGQIEGVMEVMEVMEGKPLSRDAVYVGSATLAGLAIFGSLIGIRISDVLRLGTRAAWGGAVMMIVGPYALAGTHIVFMFTFRPTEDLLLIALISLVAVFITVAGYILMESNRHTRFG